MDHVLLFVVARRSFLCCDPSCECCTKRFSQTEGTEGVIQETQLQLNNNFLYKIQHRLNEDTFTIDEVEEMLDGLLAVVRGEVESELINTAHTNVLLLRQVFIQAEKWHLKLQADISELENRFVGCLLWNYYEEYCTNLQPKMSTSGRLLFQHNFRVSWNFLLQKLFLN